MMNRINYHAYPAGASPIFVYPVISYILLAFKDYAMVSLLSNQG